MTSMLTLPTSRGGSVEVGVGTGVGIGRAPAKAQVAETSLQMRTLPRAADGQPRRRFEARVVPLW